MTISESKRALTNSGDYYTATSELWEAYWEAVKKDNWDFVRYLEEGRDLNFRYDP